MTRSGAFALAIVLILPAAAGAHRLDEYLQATRVAVSSDSVTIEVDLTPGANVAAHVVRLIDRDNDGRITSGEAHAYGQAVLADLVLTVDGRTLPLSLTEVEVPAIDAMQDGMGTIGVRASAVVPNAAQRHNLRYRNDHESALSVHAVNALMPDTRSISIGKQRRDERQREFHLEYEVRPGGAIEWTLAAGVLLAGLLWSRRFAAAAASS
jgi:hypothetical protein